MNEKNIAELFATALDDDDFEAVHSLLDENCIYQLPDKQIAGRSEIIASYRESSEWGEKYLDSVEYSSEIESLPNGEFPNAEFIVRFIDKIQFQQNSHTYWCKQLLRLNSAGKICFIEHWEDPEQRRLLDQFFRSNGLSRDR